MIEVGTKLEVLLKENEMIGEEIKTRISTSEGVAVTALAETLGHKDVRTTRRYTHASKAGKLRVVQAQERREAEYAGHNSLTNEKRQAS